MSSSYLADFTGNRSYFILSLIHIYWKRPQDEVTTIMNLVVEYLKKETDDLIKENVKMDFIGDIEALPDKTLSLIHI